MGMWADYFGGDCDFYPEPEPKSRVAVVQAGFVTYIYFSKFPGRELLDHLKKHGAVWDPDEKRWSVDSSRWKDVQEEVLHWAYDGLRTRFDGELFEPLDKQTRKWLEEV